MNILKVFYLVGFNYLEQKYFDSSRKGMPPESKL